MDRDGWNALTSAGSLRLDRDATDRFGSARVVP
jgi:hypothetical protein